MTDLLVPDTPAGQMSNRWQDEEMVEPSCCGPVRPKINTTPIKLHSIVYIVCGVLSIGLGIVACVLDCTFKGLSIPAGVLLISTGVVGLIVRKHGVLAIVYGWLNLFCFGYGLTLLVFMMIALPLREGNWEEFCSSYDCKYWYTDDGCCYDEKLSLKWGNVLIDLGILVVGVIVMVTSLAAGTLSLRDLNWVKLCCLKKNSLQAGQVVVPSQSSETELEPSGQSSSSSSSFMKQCWTPCDSNGHRNATIILSIIHIIIGVISVGLGIGALIVECRYAHIGMPIWTGILIFMVTGFCGFLSTTEKGAYIPCFLAFSVLAFIMSINMFTWAAVNIPAEPDCAPKCFKWCTDDTQNSYNSYRYSTPDPRRYCCDLGETCIANTEAVVIDCLIVGFGILEMFVCMATFGLSFSQLSCYMCCHNGCCSNCKCVETQTNTAYQMVMTTDGNLMMVPVPITQHGMTPSLVNNQQMIPQPMVIPANQNQTSGSPVQPNIVGGQLLVQGNQPMMFQGNTQPMIVVPGQAPVFVQANRQPGIQQPMVPGMSQQVQNQMQQKNQPAPQSQLTNQTASTQVQAGSLPHGVESPAVVSEDANQGIEVISDPTV
ncbi:uncharacterized protein [Antedon mediterranea]|uniref:uncharacterized protein n=1 Tax=Antedon mediterranea TaxID=105859 RepID=UPI003AF72913